MHKYLISLELVLVRSYQYILTIIFSIVKYYAFQIIEKGVSMIGHTISLYPGRIQAYYWSHRTGSHWI